MYGPVVEQFRAGSTGLPTSTSESACAAHTETARGVPQAGPGGTRCNELLKHVLRRFNFKLKRAPRGVKLSGPVNRIGLTKITESGTDLNTILRCFLSFKTVVTSRNIIVFKIFPPLQKYSFLSHGRARRPR